MNNEALVTPFFRNIAVQDPNASKKAGRPIFRDVAVCEIRIAGDRNYAPTVPAHSMWKRIDGEEKTYADRWPEQYQRFLDSQTQIATGTPLSELPFLTEAKRAELRMLKVYTAEALASIDGKELRNLGAEGRSMKNQAAAYLENAAGSAQAIALAEEVAMLKEKLAQMESVQEPEDERAALKDEIQRITGKRPQGNPSADTLRQMLAELNEAA